jgi:hypothetical protein
MNVESKEYCMMISSHDIPHNVLQACAVACGIVLANYYPSELMPVAIKDNDSFLGVRGLSLTVLIYGKQRVDYRTMHTRKNNSLLTISGV